MREIRAKVRELHEKKHLPLPLGVQRLLNSAAVAKFDTWRRDVAKGHIHSSFELETRSKGHVVPDLFESVITPDFRGHEDEVTFEQYKRFLVFMEYERRTNSRKRSFDSSPERENFTSPSISSSSLSSPATCPNCNLSNRSTSILCNFCETPLYDASSAVYKF